MYAIDWGVLLRETGDISRLASYEQTMTPDDSDPPFRRARKIRFLAEIGQIQVARGILQELPAEALSRLPHDRDYLGTLVHLAAAALATKSQIQAEALYALLSPYPHLYASDLSLHSDGSVAHFLGLLADAIGRPGESVAHFEQALAANERAGFEGHAAHSAYELGRMLIATASNGENNRARELLTRALETSRRLRMHPLAQRVEERLSAF